MFLVLLQHFQIFLKVFRPFAIF